MLMSAVGTRGELIGSRATGGFALAFKADAGRLNASEAGVTRLRTALEGSRGFTLGGGRLSLRPSVEVGLRRDGGDAETGAGMDVGGGLVFRRYGHGAVRWTFGCGRWSCTKPKVSASGGCRCRSVGTRRRRARWG